MVKNLTVEEFKELVFDYAKEEEWKFKGKNPVIIDFYADWCNPCKTLAPIMEEINDEYDNIDVYKVDTESQGEIAAAFGIKNLPSIHYIPVNDQPQMVVGALPKEMLKQAIDEVLFGKIPDDASDNVSEETK